MQVGYGTPYNLQNRQIVALQQSGPEINQAATQQSRVVNGQIAGVSGQLDILKSPSTALSNAMWQIMVRRSADRTEQFIV